MDTICIILTISIVLAVIFFMLWRAASTGGSSGVSSGDEVSRGIKELNESVGRVLYRLSVIEERLPASDETSDKFPDPEKKQREYLERLCKEYVELFLEGNNQVMGGIFGFRLERNKDKRIAVPVAQMIANIRADEKLLPEQREQLWKILYQAYGVRTGGKMEYLDELLDS